MSMKRALEVILVIGLGGLAFSGYLSYQEFYGAEPSCSPVGQPGTMLGYPPCIYGFVMYLAIVAISLLGLRGGATRTDSASADTTHRHRTGTGAASAS
jgi:uncharacterized membrane protein